MKKELYNQKLELFKQLGEVKLSKKGNHYINYNQRKKDRKINIYSMYSVNTRTHNKIDSKEITLTRTQSDVILLTKTGVLKMRFANSFVGIKRKSRYIKDLDSIKSGLQRQCLKISFLGKKYEYLYRYPELLHFSLAYDFSSIDDFKKYLGYEDITVSRFLFFISNYPEIAINGVLFPGETLESIKSNLNLKDVGNINIRDTYHTDYYHLFNKILSIKQRLEIPVQKDQVQRLMGILLDKYTPNKINYTMIDLPF